MKLKSKGFTLIELLVVVAIISLLSSVVLASVREARDKAKETAFVSFLLQLKNAMELYKSEVGHYPYGNFEISNWEDTVGILNPVKTGDFNSQTFLSLIDLDYLTLSKLPKNSGVWVSTNNAFSGWYYDWAYIVVCSGQEKPMSSHQELHDTYAIVVDYDPNIKRGPLKSFENTLIAQAYGTEFFDASNGDWWYGNTACIN